MAAPHSPEVGAAAPLQKRLCDYFAVLRRTNQGKVTCFSFPQEQHDDSPFPGAHVVGMFCFPLLEHCDQRQPVNFFTLTAADYSHTYGACLRFPIPGSEAEEDDPVVEQAVCLLSHFPFFRLFEHVLNELYAIYMGGTLTLDDSATTGVNTAALAWPPPLERFFCYLVYEVPVPGRAETLHLSLRDGIGTGDAANVPPFVQGRQPIAFLPEIDPQAFRVLFDTLSVENVLLCVEAILMEQRILLMSENFHILTPVGEALCALIFPLQWQLIYIPMLPSYMTMSLKSPVNYIVGVHTTSVLESEEDLELPSALVVYLDDDKVISPVMCEIALATGDSNGGGDSGDMLDTIPKLPSTLRTGLGDMLRTIVEQRTASPSSTIWTVQVQACFLRVFLRLFSSYRRYHPGLESSSAAGHGGTAVVNFNVRGFLQSRVYMWRQFLSALVQTQSFHEFLQAAARGDPEVNAFDRYLELERANSRAGKRTDDPETMLFVPSVKLQKTVTLKPDSVNLVPVERETAKFQTRREQTVRKGLFPCPDADFMLPPRVDIGLTRLREGVAIDGNNVPDASPMPRPPPSAHKRGRNTREVSHMIVQRSLKRVESLDMDALANGQTVILSPSTFATKPGTTSPPSDWAAGSADSFDAARPIRTRHRRTTTTPAEFTPAMFRTISNLRVSPAPGSNSPFGRRSSASVDFASPRRRASTATDVLIEEAGDKPGEGDANRPRPSSRSSIVVAEGGQLMSHFDAVRKALARSRARADAAEVKADTASQKLKEMHVRMVEMQRELRDLREQSSPHVDAEVTGDGDLPELQAAMEEKKKVNNMTKSQGKKLAALEVELHQHNIYDTVERGGSQSKSPSVPRGVRTRRSTVSAAPGVSLVGPGATSSNRKDAEIRALKEKVADLNSRLNRMRRFSEMRSRRNMLSGSVSGKNNEDPIGQKLKIIKKALHDEAYQVDQRYEDIAELRLLVEKGTKDPTQLLSDAIDISHLKSDLNFQLNTLLHLNQGLAAIISRETGAVESSQQALATKKVNAKPVGERVKTAVEYPTKKKKPLGRTNSYSKPGSKRLINGAKPLQHSRSSFALGRYELQARLLRKSRDTKIIVPATQFISGATGVKPNRNGWPRLNDNSRVAELNDKSPVAEA